MTTSFWQERLERCPALRPWLLRAAKRAVSGVALMPASLTLGDVPQDKAVRRALEDIFPGCRELNGRLKARLDETMRECSRWQPLAELLGVSPPPRQAPETPGKRLARTLRRLKLLYPDDRALIDALREDVLINRLFKSSAAADKELTALYDALVYMRDAPAGMTLSELGAKFFNDSKSLRGGPLRQQLEHLLRVQGNGPDDDTDALLNACGIIENPYTTHVVVFAPFSYRTCDGARLGWPNELWRRGEAVILPWRTVRTIADIRFEEPCGSVVTSENAAPFHRLVETGRAALYTEGYPNAAVKTLLRHFAQAGASALHWGDTDLDGYRIAEQIARAIPARLYLPPAGRADRLRKKHMRLTDEQRRRLLAFIDAHPAFPFLDGLRYTLQHGWLEQEQTIDGLL
ncbi:MAG: DUF2220 family protein [Kiritimatiellae bacterium]|nr:DUF2220 family protein [Kiritimatiellia bacterium]